MKKVVISGYYGFHNTGDEAILEGILLALRQEAARRGEEIAFTVLSASPAETAARHQVAAIGRMKLVQIMKALLSCDLFISGGGGLLQDTTGRSLSVAYYLGLVLLARLLGKPTVLYAHGIGPVRKALNRLLVRLVVNRITLVTLRDAASKQELEQMGVTRPLLLTADPAFYLQPESVASFAHEQPVIAVAVRSWHDDGYLQEIAGAADALAEEFAAKLVLVPMYFQEDLSVTKKLAGMLRRPAVVLDEYLPPAQLLNIFAQFNLVLSVRLHALIFAALAGVPMVGIGYDPKVDAFLLQLGLASAGDTQETTAAELVRQGRERLLSRENLHKELLAKSKQFRLQAQKTACMVADILFESGEKP